MEGLSIGGLASGLDTNAIIDGLTGIEESKVKRIVIKENAVQLKLDAFKQLQGKISSFADTASSLDDIKAFNLYESTSSDEEAVTITGDENATPGSYNLEIDSLATQWKLSSKAYSGFTTALNLAGKFELSKSKEAIENDPIETTLEIEINANDSLKDIVNKINGLDGAGVRASLISLNENEHRLVLSAVDEGADGFYLKDTGGSNILDSNGLGVLDYSSKIKSDFNLRLNTIGVAQTTTPFSELFAGIGQSSAIDAGDEISITGTDANGNNVAGTLTLGAGSTIQNLLDQVKTVYESQGSTVNVSLNESGQISITDTSSGLQDMTLNMQFNDANGSGSQLSLSSATEQGVVQNNFQNVLSEGKKAFYNIDGLSVSSEGNQDDRTVTGVTFNLLKAETGISNRVEIKRDDAGIVEKIQGFVDAYNDVMNYIAFKSKIQTDGDDENSNKKTKVKSVGPFASDSSIYKIKNDLRTMVTSSIQELGDKSVYTSMASIGVTSKSDGTLSIDASKVEKALNQDFSGFRNLFITNGYSDNPSHTLGSYDKNTESGTYSIDTGSEQIDGVDAVRSGVLLTSKEGDSKGLIIDSPSGTGVGSFTFTRGIASQISKYWAVANDPFEGTLSTTKKGFEKSIERFRDRATEMEKKVETFRQRLIKQFSDLEMRMSRLQQQSSSFQAQIG